MAFKYFRRAAVALTLLAMAGCTVKSTEPPAPTGPSGLALTLTLNAIPDSISQDGGSQSSVKILAIGPDGKPLSGVPLRLDMAVGGVSQDFGTLSARSVVTNGDGVATAVYTAPPSLAGGVACSGLPGNCVAIVATATSTSFATANPEQVLIRLVPTGVILPPANAPTASFAVSPQPVQMNVAATFDASASTPGTGASAITSYAWTFGDGTSGTGRTINHTFTAQQSFNVTLTVTNDRGLSASTTSAVSVGAVSAPNPTFVFSPGSPTVAQTIVFNGDQSTAAPGHNLTAFSWNFGDGATASGSIASHAYSAAGAYNVVLSVTDDTGQKVAKSLTVTVVSAGGGGGGAGGTTAAFVASPSSPVVGQVVFFNASSSSAATGHTLTKYAWDFGDGTAFSGSASTTNHTFSTPGSFTVSLVVTDDGGTTAKTANTVTVAAAGAAAPTANFTTSPASPGVNQSVFFNGSTSTPGAGHTISTYAWDYGDGSTGTGVTPSHAYNRAGQFTVNLVVTDEAGQTGSKSGTVTVTGTSSQIVADFTFSPTDPKMSGVHQVFFDATPSSSPNTITSYVWDFGDGSAAGSGQKPNHTYAAAQTYTIRLTVTDSAGGTATTTKTITVGS